jgi:hypothetical protein
MGIDFVLAKQDVQCKGCFEQTAPLTQKARDPKQHGLSVTILRQKRTIRRIVLEKRKQK